MTEAIRRRAINALIYHNYSGERCIFEAVYIVGNKIFLTHGAAEDWHRQVARKYPIEIIYLKDTPKK